MAHGIHGWVWGLGAFWGFNGMGRKPNNEASTTKIDFGVKLRLTADHFLFSA
jgi:hypothetical protein